MDYKELKEKIAEKIRAVNPWDETVCEMCYDYGFNADSTMSCCADGELIAGKQKCPTNELAITSLTDQILNIRKDCENCNGTKVIPTPYDPSDFRYVYDNISCPNCDGKGGRTLGDILAESKTYLIRRENYG